jgi:hypothetical protein
MRIGTWNVEYARPMRMPALLEVMTSNAADIWFLTETNDSLQPAGCSFSAHSDPRPQGENPKNIQEYCKNIGDSLLLARSPPS